MKEERSPFYNLVLLFLSVYVLCALLVEAFWVSDSEIKLVLQYIDFAVCVMFLIDFFVCLMSAKSKLSYMKWGWLNLVSSIPAVDPLRWGRVSKIVRIIRYLRAVKSIKVLLTSLHVSRFETLTLSVFLVVFLSFSLSSAFILDFEKGYDSQIKTAESAIWWSFLNIMNAKAAISQAVSSEGVMMTLMLNKVGLLLFAYTNSMVVAWLIMQSKVRIQNESVAGNVAESD